MWCDTIFWVILVLMLSINNVPYVSGLSPIVVEALSRFTEMVVVEVVNLWILNVHFNFNTANTSKLKSCEDWVKKILSALFNCHYLRKQAENLFPLKMTYCDRKYGTLASRSILFKLNKYYYMHFKFRLEKHLFNYYRK